MSNKESLYRKNLAHQAWLVKKREEEALKASNYVPKPEKQVTPEELLRTHLKQALWGKEAVVVLQEESTTRHEIGAGSIASGSVFYSHTKRETARELWYANNSGEVVLTASAEGVFEGDNDDAKLEERALTLDDVVGGQRLVFPKRVMRLFGGNPNDATVEKLVDGKWKTFANAKLQPGEYRELVEHFNALWSQRKNLALKPVR